ncbi:MAG: glucose 1-dehydrogenase [Deltaproteobacteria bacterium]|nr:glucose 1-dehydrogenase [Deltaproteobacteria bacterium]
MGRLEGKTAIVTGGSRGIGQAIATAFAREGATVVITSRKQEGLDRAAEEIREATGVEVVPLAAHVGRVETLDAWFTALDARVGTADVLVNNAGTILGFGPMIDLEWPAWDKTFEVNLKGAFEMSRQVARRLISTGRSGSIINITSIVAYRGSPMQGIYAMTKAAMISLTQTLAMEWGPAKLRVNAMAPGLVDTRLAAALVHNDAFLRMFTDRAALGRPALPDEMAGLAVYLASDEASFVTGHTFPLDGGYLAA